MEIERSEVKRKGSLTLWELMAPGAVQGSTYLKEGQLVISGDPKGQTRTFAHRTTLLGNKVTILLWERHENENRALHEHALVILEWVGVTARLITNEELVEHFNQIKDLALKMEAGNNEQNPEAVSFIFQYYKSCNIRTVDNFSSVQKEEVKLLPPQPLAQQGFNAIYVIEDARSVP